MKVVSGMARLMARFKLGGGEGRRPSIITRWYWLYRTDHCMFCASLSPALGCISWLGIRRCDLLRSTASKVLLLRKRIKLRTSEVDLHIGGLNIGNNTETQSSLSRRSNTA